MVSRGSRRRERVDGAEQMVGQEQSQLLRHPPERLVAPANRLPEQVLFQAGVSVLASANLVSQSVLTLLR